jgi:hypothetical protein
MKSAFFILSSFFLLNQASALELVCKGSNASSPNQKIVIVDCENRQKLSAILLESAQVLAKNPSTKGYADTCYKGYQSVEEWNPKLGMAGISSSAISRCNLGLANL